MKVAANLRLPALVCALTLPICAVAIGPRADIGMYDDWSYIWTARVLAQTGRIAYNGWATAMLGWQLFPAALFIRLFGFSFSIVRSTTLLVAMGTAFLIQRCLVRSGLREWNATITTLTFILSPLFLPLAMGFMTDIFGLFSIVLCFYACLRAQRTQTSRAALGWICFAAISNALGGTARQIAWLGVLVMVPSALWLLRRRLPVLLVGGIAALGSVAFIVVALHWFHLQPYSVPEPLLRSSLDVTVARRLLDSLFRSCLELPLLMLPVMLMFVPESIRSRGPGLAVIGVGSLAFGLAGVRLHERHGLASWLAPFLATRGNYLSIYGLFSIWPIKGERPTMLNTETRVFITMLAIVALLCFIAFVLENKRKLPVPPHPLQPISWHDLGVLVLPFTFAYATLLLPRAAFVQIFDRYLVPMLMFALLVLARYYQERVRRHLPVVSLLLVLLVGLYGVAATHDLFAMYRGCMAAINEIRATGVPAAFVDGGWEYNGWTQVARGGFVYVPGMRTSNGSLLPAPTYSEKGDCAPESGYLFPDLVPRYSLSFRPDLCEGPAGFAPVVYRTWLTSKEITIYIVGDSASLNH